MGKAETLIREYWEVCEKGDFNNLVRFFTEDAVLVDPIYGAFEGRQAIAGFMADYAIEAQKIDNQFWVDEVCGEESTAWARWAYRTPAGNGTGSSIFRLRDGLIVFEQDYTNPPASND